MFVLYYYIVILCFLFVMFFQNHHTLCMYSHRFATLSHFFTLISIAVNLSECQKVEQSDSTLPSPLMVQSPVEAFFTNSPLKSLVASPQRRSKQNQVRPHKYLININKKPTNCKFDDQYFWGSNPNKLQYFQKCTYTDYNGILVQLTAVYRKHC